MEKRCWISARKKQELLIWTTRTKMILISCGFLWGGEKSPLCGRKLKTFEREYVDKESLWTEESNPYYSKYYDESFCCQILHEFGLYDDDSPYHQWTYTGPCH